MNHHYDPSEYACIDEEQLVADMEDYEQWLKSLEDIEFNESDFASTLDGEKPDMWNDLNEVDTDDIPF